jgi:hypothetical protein
VRELFEEEPPKPPRKTRGDLMKDIDAYYYGYLDDEDGVLMKLEEEVENKGVSPISSYYILQCDSVILPLTTVVDQIYSDEIDNEIKYYYFADFILQKP